MTFRLFAYPGTAVSPPARKHPFFGVQARAALLSLAALLGSCVSAPPSGPLPSLDSVFAFTRPHLCDMAEPLEGLFGGLFLWDDVAGEAKAGPPVRLPGTDQFLTPRLRRIDGDYQAILAPLRGRWLGLTVTGIETAFIPETDQGWRSIHFADPPGAVTAALNRAGFGLDSRTRSAEVAFHDETWSGLASLGVSPRPGGGSTLVCDVGQ